MARAAPPPGWRDETGCTPDGTQRLELWKSFDQYLFNPNPSEEAGGGGSICLTDFSMAIWLYLQT